MSLLAAIKPRVLMPVGMDAASIWREKIGDDIDDPALRAEIEAVVAHPAASALMGGICAHAPFLTGILRRHPEWISDLFHQTADESHDSILNTVRACAAQLMDEAELMQIMRLQREKNALLVALADLGGVWDVTRVTAALSDFADAAVNAAIDHLLAGARDSEKLLPRPGQTLQQASGLIILAMGKHGARELNYSSDIDLIVFYDPEQALLAEDVEPSSYYVRLTKGLVKLLQSRTQDGYVARVDLRLRPDPGSSATAISVATAYNYYESVGQNWERAAFIKARAIAGDIALGEHFIKGLTPFIWRKYFDYAAIADVHAMKRQIQTARGHGEIAVAGHDIKLGRGGIREIEFFVQTQQLVFGGRKPALRGRRTVEMLSALVDENWISTDARDELTDCYNRLRAIEHRLQMRMDEQTQRLPQDQDELTNFARFCGFADAGAFGQHLTEVAQTVQRHYARLFEEAETLASDIGSLVFTGTSDDPETIETLTRLGFREPPTVMETIRGWHFGRRASVTSARAREVLTELVPLLLQAFGKSADPDGAIIAFDKALNAMPGAVELFSILRNNPKMLALFADVLGSAPRLAEIVATHPHVLDSVIDPHFVSGRADPIQIEQRLRLSIGAWTTIEECLDRMRDVGRQEMFMTGARMLSGLFSPEEAGRAYSAIADALIRIALEAVTRVFQTEHGTVKGGAIAILGLGKLGGSEMTSSSDLDLVAIYDFDESEPESSGPRKLHAVQYFTRLTQRLVTALTAQTRRGFLYDVDMRLRPSGSKGPVASQWRGWLEYQKTEAEVWEHMALSRARPIAGEVTLLGNAAIFIRTTIQGPRPPSVLRDEVFNMRKLIAQEKGENDPDDLKLVKGGLLDCEFIAQYLVLRYAGDMPDLLTGNTETVLALARQKSLLQQEEATAVLEGYILMRDVQHWQRLTMRGSFKAQSAGPAVLQRIANAANCPDYRNLQARLAEAQQKIRETLLQLAAG